MIIIQNAPISYVPMLTHSQEVDDAVEKINQAIAELKCFQWLDCSDDELKQAREINGKLQDLAKKIRAINKKR